MRVYLLNPPFMPNFVRCGRWQGVAARSGGMDYPKWLAYATGMLEDKAHEVRLIDAPAQKWDRAVVLKDVLTFAPNLIVIESNFSSLQNDIEVASLLKKQTNAVTVLVGPPASQFAEAILQNDGIDIVARYEYDFTIQEIVHSLEINQSLADIKGISYKVDGKIVNNSDREYSDSESLDKIPFVSKVYKKHLNIKHYFLSQSLYPVVQIFTGRGCPYKCSFCSWPETLMGRKYRSRSAKNIVDEFQYIKDEIPEVKEIFIEDDTFTINNILVRDVCIEIRKRGLKLIWSCNARASLDYETMTEMKKAGCRLIIVGYESGNDEILKRIHKGTNTEQLRKFTKAAKKAGLLIHGDFIIGLPGETKKTAEETIKFIQNLKPNVLQVAIATPIPGTEFFRWAKENGFLLTVDMGKSIDASGFQKCIISYPDFTKADIEYYVDQALKRYYLRPSFIPVILSNIFRRNGFNELCVMARSAKVFLGYLGRSK
jgi:anaerobic magnesium-protoporphyrin IX monomethyl ester cyclase